MIHAQIIRAYMKGFRPPTHHTSVYEGYALGEEGSGPGSKYSSKSKTRPTSLKGIYEGPRILGTDPETCDGPRNLEAVDLGRFPLELKRLCQTIFKEEINTHNNIGCAQQQHWLLHNFPDLSFFDRFIISPKPVDLSFSLNTKTHHIWRRPSFFS